MGKDTDLIVGDDSLARPTWAATDRLLRDYYDHEWGMPVHDDRGMFERLSLEAFQSGLSWATILRKRPAFRRAFADFVPEKVAAMTDRDVEKLMEDSSIVRNRRKIQATVNNAKALLANWGDGGATCSGNAFAEFVWGFKPEKTPAPRSMNEVPTFSKESAALAKALKARGFQFVGPTTMFALMEAVGIVDTHLIGSHRRGSSGIWS